MRRSRTALTLFLGALAAGLQTAGFADVRQETARQTRPRQIIDCYADAPDVAPPVRPVAFAEDWYLDNCNPDYDCYGAYGADCYHGPLANSASPQPVLLDARPIEEYEYGYEWDCEISCDDQCEVYLATPRVHLEDLSAIAADARHSTGHAEVLRINQENDGLPTIAASAGVQADDLPANEAAYMAGIAARGRAALVSEHFDYGYDDYSYTDEYVDGYGAWHCDEYADCNPEEPDDLPPAEMQLHVATQAAPAAPSPVYNYDYEYDYGYDYAQYGEASASDYSYDEYDYSYDEYVAPYAADAAVPGEPAFASSESQEPADLPTGEPLGEDDLPASEEPSSDLPPREDLFEDMPEGEDSFDLPAGEVSIYVLPEAQDGDAEVPGHEVIAADLPEGEDISDLPPAEPLHGGESSLSRDDYRNDYEYGYDYSYQCDCDEYQCYGDRGMMVSSRTAQPVVYDGRTLRPVLRTASWMLSQMADALSGLSQSMQQIAAEQQPEEDSSVFAPPEMDYPWPTILGRKPDRNAMPGL